MSFPEIEFLKVSDALKSINRRSLLHDGSRVENSAEHSWHLALAVMTFHGLSEVPLNLERALQMAILHDLVEIDAGDSFVYDAQAMADKAEREQKAAEKIFGMLPQGQEWKKIWEEYEEGTSAEALFVGALDRFLPVLANCETGGRAWKAHGVTLEQVLERNSEIAKGSPRLWAWAEAAIRRAYA